MTYVIRRVKLAGVRTGALVPDDPAAVWLRHFDPDGEYRSPQRSNATWTASPSLALQFATVADAHAAWAMTSVLAPTRPDGKPNRPLTAYTIQVLSLADALAEVREP